MSNSVLRLVFGLLLTAFVGFQTFGIDLSKDIESSVIAITKQYIDKNKEQNLVRPAIVVADPEVVPKELQDQSVDKALIPLIEGVLSRSMSLTSPIDVTLLPFCKSKSFRSQASLITPP